MYDHAIESLVRDLDAVNARIAILTRQIKDDTIERTRQIECRNGITAGLTELRVQRFNLTHAADGNPDAL